MKQVLKEIGFGERQIVLLTDSTAAYYIAGQPSSGERRKHIDIQHHFVKDNVDKGIVKIQWVPSHEQLADFLTKPARKATMRVIQQTLFN